MLLNISYSDYPNFNVYNIKYEVRLVLNIAEDLRRTFTKSLQCDEVDLTTFWLGNLFASFSFS